MVYNPFSSYNELGILDTLLSEGLHFKDLEGHTLLHYAAAQPGFESDNSNQVSRFTYFSRSRDRQPAKSSPPCD